MKFPVTPRIKEELTKAGIRHPWANISVHDDSYVYLRELIDNGGYGHLSDEERHAITVGCCYTHPDHKEKHLEPLIHPIKKASARYATQLNESLEWNVFSMIAFRGIVIILLGLILVAQAHCQMASSAGPSSSAPSPMQTSQIDVITFRTSTGTVVRSYASPFNIKEGTGVTFSATPSTLTINAAGGAGGYATIQNVGVAITQRAIINLLAAFTCVDNAGTVSSDCKLAANAAVANQYLTGVDASGNLLRKQIAYGELSGVPSTFASTPHPLLDSSVDSDTAVGTVARGDLITGQSISPKWTRLAKGTANQILAMDGTGTDIVWTIPLVKAQQVVSTVYTDQNNTYSASTVQDMDTARAKYWGSAPVFDASEYAGADMCAKIAAVYADAAYTAASTAIIDATGFTGSQNCASNMLAITRPTWIKLGSVVLHVTVAQTTSMPTNTNPSAPTIPVLASSTTTGGTLNNLVLVKVGLATTGLLPASGGYTAPSPEATFSMNAACTGTPTCTATVTAPTAAVGSWGYNVYEATTTGAEKLCNPAPIPFGVNYVIKANCGGVAPNFTNFQLVDKNILSGVGDSTRISLENSSAAIDSGSSLNWLFKDFEMASTLTTQTPNGMLIVTSGNDIDNITFLGGGTHIYSSGGGPMNVRRTRHFGFTATNQAGLSGFFCNNCQNIRVEDIFFGYFTPPVTAGTYNPMVSLSNCIDCIVDGFQMVDVDNSNAALSGTGAVATGGGHIIFTNFLCDGNTNINCFDAVTFVHDFTADTVNCRNSNNFLGVGVNTGGADCGNIFMATKWKLDNINAQHMGGPGGLCCPSLEIYQSPEGVVSNSQFNDGQGTGGIAIVGSPRVQFSNVTASRNFSAGLTIADTSSVVTCNGTPNVVWVSGQPFGPWNLNDTVNIGAGPTAFQISSVTDPHNLVLTANCSLGASQAFTVYTQDFSAVNLKADDNGQAGTGTGARTGLAEGVSLQGHSIARFFGGGMNDNAPVLANKHQQYAIRAENSSAFTAIGVDGSGNGGGTGCGKRLLPQGSTTEWFCDTPGNSSAIVWDGTTNRNLSLTPIESNFGLNDQAAAAIVADTGAINTTETVIVKSATMPANRLVAGTVISIPFAGTNTSSAANTSTFTLRMGTAGTTADTAIFTAVMAVSATTGTNVSFTGEVFCTVRTAGASGTGFCRVLLVNPNATSVATASTGISVIPLQSVLPTMSTFNTTTANNIISLTYKSAATTTTSIFKEAAILFPAH